MIVRNFGDVSDTEVASIFRVEVWVRELLFRKGMDGGVRTDVSTRQVETLDR
jgi:hypothetical protein